eukprot:Hpha_TRINITY_DN16952_c4_g1::TRINITY_DN16952_c4_g1_i1::g.53837::m.53837/K00434/E1.11.1.11; L-ascorbate peroxidase
MQRLSVIASHVQAPGSGTVGASAVEEYRANLLRVREELRAFIHKESCHPIMIRLAWHDSGTFDKNGGVWPLSGGANGSIRFEAELAHGANAGLKKAVNYLRPFKDKYPSVSWADLMQMASALAVELAGGPVVPMRYGRVDVGTAQECPREGNLPAAGAPFPDGAKDAATHLRNVFYRMGFDDREIVALSGAHTLGRAFKDRSGTVKEGYGEKAATKFTGSSNVARADGNPHNGMAGGRSWTQKWLSFDNSYYHTGRLPQATQKELLVLETDKAVAVDPNFAPHYNRYAADPAQFANEYALVHAKLSELGSKFEPAEGIRLH